MFTGSQEPRHKAEKRAKIAQKLTGVVDVGVETELRIGKKPKWTVVA
jgi:hypothetical protein